MRRLMISKVTLWLQQMQSNVRRISPVDLYMVSTQLSVSWTSVFSCFLEALHQLMHFRPDVDVSISVLSTTLLCPLCCFLLQVG